MFRSKPNAETEELNKEITRVLSELKRFTPETKEYANAADQLVKLYAQKVTVPSRRVSPDQLLLVGGNLLGILVIVGYESRNVISSKALGFIGKSVR